MSKLTEKQAEVLAFIKGYIKENGIPPTRAEVADFLGVYPSAAQSHIVALAKKGYITFEPQKSRCIKVVKGMRVRIKK